MWLPHGLAAGVTPADLQPLLSICKLSNPRNANSPCAPLGFNLTRLAKGRLRMGVPGLEPRQRYRVEVKGSDRVKDAFGLALQVRGQEGCAGAVSPLERCHFDGRGAAPWGSSLARPHAQSWRVEIAR
jgi:hypothetical protein